MHRSPLPSARRPRPAPAARRGRGVPPALRLLLAALGALCILAARVPPAGAQARAEFVPTFSTNSRVEQQVAQLRVLAEQKKWDEWAAAYQQLLDDPRDLVLPRDDEFLVGARYHLHQTLAALPAPARQRYRALHDGEARKLYDRAAADNDGAAMRDLYSRYRFTTHGPRALLWLANRALDEGRPEMARVAYSRLARDPAATAGLLLRYALAADRAGKPGEARGVLERLRREFAAQPVHMGGQQVTAAAAADTLARAFQPAAPPLPGAWTTFAGERGERKMGLTLQGGARRLWEFQQATGTDGPVTRSLVIISSSYSSARGRFSYLTFPAIRGDRVWVQSPRMLSALDLATGRTVWEQRDFQLERHELPADAGDPRTFISSYRSSQTVQAAPSVEGHRLVSRVPLTQGERDSTRRPADYAIAMYDARTGSPLWRKIAGGDPRGLYFNIPTLQANTVFTGVVTTKGGITEYSAVALDAGTGEPLWTTYLGAGSDPLTYVDGSPPAVRDGLVWIESSLYTLSALDLLTGEIRLVYRYHPTRRLSSYRGGMDSSPQISNEPISLVAVPDGPILFAPRWGIYAVAINPATGRLQWASPKAPGQSATGALFAVDERHAYIGGDHVRAISLANGSPVWTWDPQVSSGSLGYPILSGDRVYVPLDGKIHVRAAADGKELEVLDISRELGENPGYLALVAVEGALVVTTRDRVIAFGPK